MLSYVYNRTKKKRSPIATPSTVNYSYFSTTSVVSTIISPDSLEASIQPSAKMYAIKVPKDIINAVICSIVPDSNLNTAPSAAITPTIAIQNFLLDSFCFQSIFHIFLLLKINNTIKLSSLVFNNLRSKLHSCTTATV